MDYTTRMLRQAFLEAAAAAGFQLTRLQGVVGHRGPVREIYVMPDGRTVRLRTNRKRGLITSSDGTSPENQMNLEGQQDFIGIAIPGPRGNRGTAQFYLVPTEVAVAALREAHREWIARNGTGMTSYVRSIWFDGEADLPWKGFATKWEQYRLTAVTSRGPEQPDASVETLVNQLIAKGYDVTLSRRTTV
jgi:hypothetical protein